MNTEPSVVGLYIHVPFCMQKCPYCDFYSLPCSAQWEATADAYTDAVIRDLVRWSDRLNVSADTLYFGGGTPSLLGGMRIARIVETAAHRFRLGSGGEAEITLEANPGDDLGPVMRAFSDAGGNRVSLGMQSACDEELRLLGRRHTALQTELAVQAAQAAGIDNLSLDLMLGIPGQTETSLARSIAACKRLGAVHVSAYLLKIEDGTPYAAQRETLGLPDEDTAAAVYLIACDLLEKSGYRQYEISNFARPGRESRHNSKYWDGLPYLGIGPSAHSFLGGRRFYAPRDLGRFLTGATPIDEEAEEDGGIAADSPEEALMLRLRLTEGLRETDFRRRFGEAIPAVWRERAGALAAQSGQDGPTLLICDDVGIRLTREGFLVSNSIIARILG